MYIPKPSKYDPDSLGHFGILVGAMCQRR